VTRHPVHRIWGGKEACWLVAVVALVTLAGCDQGFDGGESGAPAPGPAASSSPLNVGQSFAYRTLDNLHLTDVDEALAAGAVVNQLSGPAMEFNVVSGVLYFLAPEERLSDSSSVLRLIDAAGRERQVAFQWSGRVARATPRMHAPEPISLVGYGIGLNGAVGAQVEGICFVLSGMMGIDPAATRVSLESAAGSTAIESWFDWHEATGTLALRSTLRDRFLSYLRHARTATLTFSFATPARDTTIEFEQALSYAEGTLAVAVKSPTGAAVQDLAGTRFVLRGFNSGTTAIGVLDAAGVASFSGLVADTYEITEVRLEPGVRLTSFATLSTASSKVDVTITRDPGAAAGRSNPQGRRAS
jgi:hypothetical protein